MRDLEGALETKRKRKSLHAKGNPSLKKLDGVNLEDYKQLENLTADGQLEPHAHRYCLGKEFLRS